MANYLGARFFKCDLQMQTPADARHWEGESFDLQEDPIGAAEAYIQRCYDVGLEAIAITDHNFASKEFLPLLKDAAKKLKTNYEITIFPGFEVSANVGMGCHVLAIFEPDTDLVIIDRLLSECGIPAERTRPGGGHANSTSSLQDIINVVQQRIEGQGLRGIVICPHSQSDDGIFDNDRIAEWLQQEEFTNPDLLALEIPKSPKKMSAGWQKLLSAGDDCDPEWKRDRPIACIMSSDTKALEKAEGITNYIGSRHTWIKMSKPSVEGLRQAFIDHHSRVRLGDEFPENPEEDYTHPYIRKVSIVAADFLSDQELVFSQNLNAIIGGRGTGKSTLIEYLRFALDRGAEVPDGLTDDYNSLMSTLNDESEIEVEYDKGREFSGQEWFLSTKGLNPPTVTGPGEVGSTTAFFPVNVYSRGQIEAIAKDPGKQRSILDDTIRTKLENLRAKEIELKAELRRLNQNLSRSGELLEMKGRLTAQIADLTGKIKHIESLATPIGVWSVWAQEADAQEEIEQIATNISEEIGETLTEEPLDDLHDYEEFENADVIEAYKTGVEGEIKLLTEAVAAKRQEFDQRIKALKKTPPFQAWEKGLDKAQVEYEHALESLREAGIDPEDHKSMVSQIAELRGSLKAVVSQIKRVDDDRKTFEDLYNSELLAIWLEQSKLRIAAAQELNIAVPQTKIGTPTVNITVEPFGDFQGFLLAVRSARKDGRRISDPDWEVLMKHLWQTAKERKIHPIQLFGEWSFNFVLGEPMEGYPESLSEDKVQVIDEWLDEVKQNEMKLERVPDFIKVELHRREDGKRVGDLASRNLSAGQKATTVLSIILAKGSSPIIIDQPEDDLDNEFVYQQLVPVLRSSKEQRQVIVVSHNANIPVNGDAELIVPFEVRDGKGSQKETEEISCVGALDHPATQTAVEVILEGSAEAFKRRFEKYGF